MSSQIENNAFIAGLILGVMFSSLFTAALTSMSLQSHYRNAAVERGYAEYDNKTGEWQWIEPNDPRRLRTYEKTIDKE